MGVQPVHLHHGALGDGDGGRRHGGDLRDGRDGRGEQLVRRGDAVGQADAQRLVGLDAPSGEDQFAGHGASHALRQAHRAAEARDQAQVDLRLAEAGALGSVDEVAGQREFAAAAQGEAVDRGDDRDLQGFEAFGDHVHLAGIGQEGRFVHGVHLHDVRPGDEGFLPRAGDDQAAVLVAGGFKPVEERLEVVDHLAGQRVQALGLVDGEDQGMVLDGQGEGIELLHTQTLS